MTLDQFLLLPEDTEPCPVDGSIASLDAQAERTYARDWCSVCGDIPTETEPCRCGDCATPFDSHLPDPDPVYLQAFDWLKQTQTETERDTSWQAFLKTSRTVLTVEQAQDVSADYWCQGVAI